MRVIYSCVFFIIICCKEYGKARRYSDLQSTKSGRRPPALFMLMWRGIAEALVLWLSFCRLSSRWQRHYSSQHCGSRCCLAISQHFGHVSLFGAFEAFRGGASRNVLRKVTRMINDSNSDQRQASSSSFCEEVFSSVTDHAADLAHDIDIILQDQDVRQRHHPGEQNRKDECYSVDFIDGCGEEQYNIQSLSLD